jgi:hypothetical protein
MYAIISKNCGLGARGAGAAAVVEDHGSLAATFRLHNPVKHILHCRVVVHLGMEPKAENYEMLRPGFEPGISDSKGRYA